MAGAFPIYTSRENPSSGATPIVGPMALPGLPTGANVAAAGEQLGRTLVTAGDRLENFGEKLGKADQQTKYFQQTTAFRRKLVDLQAQYADDPGEFNRASDEAIKEHAGGISDPLTRARLEEHLTQLGLQTFRGVERAKLMRDAKANRAALDEDGGAAVLEAHHANTPVERTAAASRHFENVVTSAISGWIAPAEVPARVAKFRSDLDEADVRAAMKVNPGAVAAALTAGDEYPNLDPVAQHRLVESAYAAERVFEWAPQREAEDEGFRRAREGTLDNTAASDDRLPEHVRARFGKFLQPQPPVRLDGARFGALLDQAVDDGRGALLAAADDFAAGRLDQNAVNRIYDTARRFDLEIAERPFAIDTRRDLVKALRPPEGAGAVEARVLDASVAAFDGWLDDNPNAGAPEARAEMLRLAQEGRANIAAEHAGALPLPRFAPVPRADFDQKALTESAARLRLAQSRLTEDELVEQAELLQRWRDILRDRAAKGAR